MADYDILDFHHHVEQTQDETLTWHRANMGARLTPEMENAFKAGFDAVANAARQLIQLHGRFKFTEKTRRYGASEWKSTPRD